MPKGFWYLICFLLFLTVTVRPWRNSSSQDDAAYMYSVERLAQGSKQIHAGSISMNLTQYSLGALILKALPEAPPIRTLNFTSWLIFSLSVGLFFYLTGIHWLFLATVFSFPIWLQYASIYHYEIFSLLLLTLTMLLIDRGQKNLPIWASGLLGVIAGFLVGTQTQSMAAFPFFWGAFLFRKRESRALGASLMIGSIAAMGAFAFVPKTPYQKAYSYWLTRGWLDMGSMALFKFPAYALQMASALGLFLFPLIQYKDRSSREWITGILGHAALYMLIYFAQISVFSAGIFFSDYYPFWAAVLFISSGFWGYWGAFPLLRRLPTIDSPIPVYGTLAALMTVWLFSTYRFAMDIRYLLFWSLPILYHLREFLKNPSALLGRKPAYLCAVVMVSLILILYMLNTTDARWQTAAELEKQGVPQNQIAAGYGWNSYTTASDCMYRSLDKIVRRNGDGDATWHSEEFFRRFLNLYGRNYEDDWVPRFVIKPSKFFGKQLDLRKHRLPGQTAEPAKFVDYTVLGIPCQLAVFENEAPKPAWCDQPD